MDMEDIIYVNNICRACLTHEGDFRSVFSFEENSGLTLHFADLIMSYTSIQISVDDGLPGQICSACASASVLFYLFKQRCEESDSILRQQLLGKTQVQLLFSDEIKNSSDKDGESKTKLIDNSEQLSASEICLKTFSGITKPDESIKDESGVEDGKNSLETMLDQDLIPDNCIDVKSEEIVNMPQKTILNCQECLKRFTKVGSLKRHERIHASLKPHYCKLCNKKFTQSEQYYSHMNTHSGTKPYVCDICNKGFNQVSNLKDHMRTHNGEKPFLCSICGKGFNQLGNLRQHTVRHSGLKSHVCSTCGSGFASKGELCAHLRKHTGARPFVCPICSHGFTTSSSLTKHKRIHSGEKPYECEVCKMKFSRSGILARHKRTHTGEKPYVCKHCTKAFSQSNDLSSHLRIHTGEKPYICDVCGQAFRQSSALKTHKKTHADRGVVADIQHTVQNFVPPITQHSNFFKNEFSDPYMELKFNHMNQPNFIPKL